MIWWRKYFFVLLILAILFSLSEPTSASMGSPSRVHPLLLEIAESTPDQIVSIIVQETGDSDRIAGIIQKLGGTVTQDLTIINALVAELPARSIPRLAQSSDVGWVSPDAPMLETKHDDDHENTATLASLYVQSIRANQLWEENPDLRGEGITVAIVDSGIQKSDDLSQGRNSTNRKVKDEFRIKGWSFEKFSDGYGHGTHVAGIIGGNGSNSDGAFMGVASGVNFIDVRVTDNKGEAATSDIVAGLQWIYDHKDEYNIRVVNLSMNSSIPESYHTSPLDAALEILWFNGIVVVVSAGNNGAGDNNGILFPPANDPFVITVGAADDLGTADPSDDVLASFSAYGTTSDGFNKPDLVAPGKNIVSILAKWKCVLAKEHPDHVVDRNYFRMSGTSMAAAVTSGSVALLLQDEPGLNPDQVKYRLMTTARPFNYGNGAGYLDIYNAVYGDTSETANTGNPASQLLWTGSDPVNWGSVNWSSVNWSSVNWSSVNWSSVNWSSVNWASVYWDD